MNSKIFSKKMLGMQRNLLTEIRISRTRISASSSYWNSHIPFYYIITKTGYYSTLNYYSRIFQKKKKKEKHLYQKKNELNVLLFSDYC